MSVQTVRFYNLETIKSRVAAVAKRAARLGCEAPTLTVLRDYTEKVRLCDLYNTTSTHKVTVRYADIELTRPSVIIPDHKLVGFISNESAKLVFPLGGHEFGEGVLNTFRGCTRCDHCGYDRARKQSFILLNPEGEYMVVGHTCMKDFTGHTVSLAQANLMAEDLVEYKKPTDIYDAELMVVLANASALTLAEGYVKAGSDGSTRNKVLDSFADPQNKQIEITEHAWDLAGRTLSWLSGLEDSKSDYLANLYAAYAAGRPSRRTFGLICSAPAAYQRQEGRQAVRKAVEYKDAYLGPVGAKVASKLSSADRKKGVERIEPTTVKVLGVSSFEGFYGLTYFVRMVTTDGVKVTWKASCPSWTDAEGNSQCEFEAGQEFRLERATIKAHREATEKYAQETTLIRCKLAAA